MRVWISLEKAWEDFGAERWVARWNDVPPNWALLDEDEKDAVEPDQYPIRMVVFQGGGARCKALARLRRAIKGGTAFGCGTVRREVVDWLVREDRVAKWQAVGEPEYVP